MKNHLSNKENVLVVKPDHIGDLILTIPAIKKIKEFYNVSILISKSNEKLAKKIFTDINIYTNSFSYISKSINTDTETNNISDFLNLFHIVIFLRNDEYMDNLYNNTKVEKYIVKNSDFLHDSIIQKNCIKDLVPRYNPNDFFCTREILKSENIGFSIGAGFTTNKWPDTYWITLIKQFIDDGANVNLIGGPMEKESIKFIANYLNIEKNNLIIGDKDFNFIDNLDFLDYVVASDSGVGHLCSLKTPVVSIFGSSPFMRYAPTGFNNYLITLNLICSPCCQFHPQVLNACLTRECMLSIEPKTLYKIITKIINKQFDFKNKIVYYEDLLICKNTTNINGY